MHKSPACKQFRLCSEGGAAAFRRDGVSAGPSKSKRLMGRGAATGGSGRVRTVGCKGARGLAWRSRVGLVERGELPVNMRLGGVAKAVLT